jgi:hypothetical protein
LTKTIEVIVLPDGQTKVQTLGFSGAACREASALLEAALGQVSSERLTVEFYASQAEQQVLRERGLA